MRATPSLCACTTALRYLILYLLHKRKNVLHITYTVSGFACTKKGRAKRRGLNYSYQLELVEPEELELELELEPVLVVMLVRSLYLSSYTFTDLSV